MVASMEVIEHVDNQLEFFENCGQRVKLGGVFVLSTIETGLVSFLLNKIAAEYIFKVVEKGEPRSSD